MIGELYLFLATLPVWILAARSFGLYARDEERADHSTVDDVVGVLHLVTIGAWLLLAGRLAHGPGRSERSEADDLLGARDEHGDLGPGASRVPSAAGD